MRTEADRTAPPIRATRRAARRRAWRALRPRRLVVRCCQDIPICPQERGERTALQVVANGKPVQGSQSFATPNKVGAHRWYTRSDPGFLQSLLYRIFRDFEIAGCASLPLR